MKLICPNCGTAHDSTYLHPSMKDLICKMCDTEFSINNAGWEDTLPVKYRPPENSDLRMYWDSDNFLEIVLPPKKVNTFKTSLMVIGGAVASYWSFIIMKAVLNTFAGLGMQLWGWFCVAVLLFWGLQWLYKRLIPFLEYQKIRINKKEVTIDKVNLFQKSSQVLKTNSAGLRIAEEKNGEEVLELMDYKEATKILERLSKEEQKWTKEMLTKVLEEVKRQ